MKVVKFGGSSLASASQLEKVLNIVKSDSERRFVVVSAPGKRNAEDTKVTDALIKYYRDYVAGNDISKSQSWIIDRYAAMVSELGLKPAVLEKISKSIHALATLPIEDNEFLYDTFLAAGENNNAKLIAAYFNQNGIDARYMHPREAGIVVTSEPGHARIIPSSYDKIEELTNTNEVLVIPGFFGVTKENQICTFSRGGSDITGSIIAAGVKADLYENFTDVDGIFAAHPGIIHQPHSIPELTYREMRELAYAGFSVLHDEALLPAYRGKIPLVIKNTNNPDHPGTRIVLKHSNDEFPVVGIAGDSGFVSINMSKYLMNREIGFGRKVLQILEELNIGWEHMPTGIDDLSIILRSRQLTPIKEEEILRQLVQKAKVDHAEIEHDLSIIMIVGEKMKSHIGVTATATRALSENKINIQMMSQGSSEVSIMFVVNKDQEKAAIKALYNAFFGESKERLSMAQSLNKTVLLSTTGTSYLSIAGKVGKFLVGDQALEFYPDVNVEQFIQIPWSHINQIGANVTGRKISRHFEVFTDKGKFLFASKDSGAILKIAREKLGNDKVVKLPTLIQTISQKFKNLFAKK